MTIIIQNIVRLIVPFIMIFGAYVTLYGHISPGGGFAGGTILAAGFILDKLAGTNRKILFSQAFCLKGIAMSLLGYGVIKGLAFMEGALHVHLVHWPLGKPGTLFSAGAIPILNILIGVVVMLSFLLIYELFSEEYDDEEAALGDRQ